MYQYTYIRQHITGYITLFTIIARLEQPQNQFNAMLATKMASINKAQNM